MKDFQYLAPVTLEDALALLSQHRDECKIIAGGQSLLILMRHGLVSPNYLIDIKGISSLDYITFEAGSGLKIGALTRHRTVETDPVIRQRFGVLAETEQRLASLETRNWGTVGGNLCHADPAGDLCPVLIAQGANVTLASARGTRTMPLEDFSLSFYQTALEHDEMLTGIEIPAPSAGTGASYQKFTIMEGDYALVSAGVSLAFDSKTERCRDARIVLGAVAPAPMRARHAENILLGKKVRDELVEKAAEAALEDSQPIADVHASEGYKRHLVRVMVRRAIQEALQKAKAS